MSWLVLGVTLGVAMAADPSLAIYRLAHAHMNLLGFVAMMIAGVAYHVLPRPSQLVPASRRAIEQSFIVLMWGGKWARDQGRGIG